MKAGYLIIICILSGCSGTLKTQEPPAGYKKIKSTSELDLYLARPDTWHYQGNKNIIQNDTVIVLRQEGTVSGHKYRSVRTRYMYDCNTENKYATLPLGFYSDMYATGKPVAPYPFSATRWLTAKKDTLPAVMWGSFCNALKKTIANYP